MTRSLRPAAELVSDIGSLGFDLQHHSTADIAEAVTFLRTVNPEMFDWLSRLLGAPQALAAVDPVDGIGQEGATRDTSSSSPESSLSGARLGPAGPPESAVTRFEVIDENGRVYTRTHLGARGPIRIELSYQDEGRTLKVFVKDRLPAPPAGTGDQP